MEGFWHVILTVGAILLVTYVALLGVAFVLIDDEDWQQRRASSKNLGVGRERGTGAAGASLEVGNVREVGGVTAWLLPLPIYGRHSGQMVAEQLSRLRPHRKN